jgi:prepilin-type N-terminal cleavage/methylation domain-containing protein
MTLLELMTVIVIVSILAVLFYPIVGWYQARARRVACGENLKGLYACTATYLTSNGGVWPQIKWDSKDQQTYAREWYNILKPYGLSWSNLICPAVQSKVGNPDFNQAKWNRMDYMAMPFDDKAWTARKWEYQPWFTERQDIHGRGPLLILTNGTLTDTTDVRKLGGNRPPPKF